jgi:hypothetical protein
MEVTMTAVDPALGLKRTQQYVALRQKIKEIKDRHKTELEPYEDTLKQLGNDLLGMINSLGLDALKSEAGTAYKRRVTSVTITDGEAFWQFVETNKLWDLLDRRAHKTAVEDYLNEKGSLPPGLNLSVMEEIGVRKA